MPVLTEMWSLEQGDSSVFSPPSCRQFSSFPSTSSTRSVTSPFPLYPPRLSPVFPSFLPFTFLHLSSPYCLSSYLSLLLPTHLHPCFPLSHLPLNSLPPPSSWFHGHLEETIHHWSVHNVSKIWIPHSSRVASCPGILFPVSMAWSSLAAC